MTFSHTDRPQVGIAYSAYVDRLIEEYPGSIDYVEIPFEHLEHAPALAAISERLPIVLHCASLSMAGTVPPSPKTVERVGYWMEKTATPWLGEHLSFVTAEAPCGDPQAEECFPGEPFNIGFSISPPQNEFALSCVERSVEAFRKSFGAPLLLENPPLYFRIPGSTMAQAEFMQRVSSQCDVSLLLDLAHFYITCQTMGVSLTEELLRLPLGKVREIHLSGVEKDGDMQWDNHASRAPDALFEALRLVLPRARVQAITLEYNWSSCFPLAETVSDLQRIRSVVAEVM
jgi:uncharacterized protein